MVTWAAGELALLTKKMHRKEILEWYLAEWSMFLLLATKVWRGHILSRFTRDKFARGVAKNWIPSSLILFLSFKNVYWILTLQITLNHYRAAKHPNKFHFTLLNQQLLKLKNIVKPSQCRQRKWIKRNYNYIETVLHYYYYYYYYYDHHHYNTRGPRERHVSDWDIYSILVYLQSWARDFVT